MKKCKCGKQFKDFKLNGLSKFKLCPYCRKEKEDVNKFKKTLTKKYQESERKRLHKIAWKLHSEVVRRTGCDWRGYGECYTCRDVKHWKEFDCGHFWHDKLDFSFENTKRQCTKCNRHLSGNLAEYSSRLLKEIGQERYDELYTAKNEFRGYTTEQLKYIIEKRKEMLLKLDNNK